MQNELENFLFESSTDFLNKTPAEELEDQDLFVIDKGQVIKEEPVKAKWMDEDDIQVQLNKPITRKLRNSENEDIIEGEEYQSRLKKQFERIHGVPEWATKTQEEHLILQSTKPLLNSNLKRISSSHLDISRQRDANYKEYSSSIITSLSWHSTNHSLLLTAGLDKTLRFFGIDGKENEKLHSIHFEKFPISQACFHGNEVIVAGSRKHFYSVDVRGDGKVREIKGIRGREEKNWSNFQCSPCGRFICFLGEDGDVVVLDGNTKQFIFTLKMNGRVCSIDFKDSDRLYTTGMDGEVYSWDMNTRQCIGRFQDEGSVGTSCIRAHNTYLATGSTCGIVNIYTDSETPYKTITNLTTRIQTMDFTRDGQILGASSRSMKDQMKLIHVASGKVFSNWPTSGTPLGYVQTFSFSPSSSHIAIGNDKGKVLLYSLPSYQ